ncbi:MAG TPA: hypothetical protein VFV32_06455 [Acidimicrobiales bacterium]|nr:hypothetical protein [Acidimicrobiales bacterium]
MTDADRRDRAASEPRVAAWRVRDTGLAPAPARHRRLPGGLRHHQGLGDAWPDHVTLLLEGDDLVVEEVGRWPRAAVTVQPLSAGPPVTFVVDVPGSSHLLAAPADEATATLLAALA